MQPSIKIKPNPIKAQPPRMAPKLCSDGEKSSFLEVLDDFPDFFDVDFF
jgi:hypothetical protein